MINEGHKVYCAVPYDSFSPQILELGCRISFIRLLPKNKNPFNEFFLFLNYLLIFIKIRPHIYFGFTIKPNIYGSVVSKLLNIPYINNIAGLGQTFSDNNATKKLVCLLYRVSLKYSFQVFFQNNEDLLYFSRNKITNYYKSKLLPGSGVDTEIFYPVPLVSSERLRITLISRLLWEKGIKEYEEAAFIIKSKGYDVEFYLFGFTDNTQGSVTLNDLEELTLRGNIIYGGRTDNVFEEIRYSHCVILPTFYNEGTPRILLESASMGRPIITTDTKGCRDVIIDGESGFLCNPRDSVDLANQIEKILKMSARELTDFGLKGREKILSNYDEKFVIHEYQQAIKRMQTSNQFTV